METYLLDWANLLLRWLHVIVAIAWIGSSFYFVFLDSSLTKPTAPDLLAKKVDGELWAVHGGGFYNPQKYLVSPPSLPQNLHWFYWESYSTWLTGFALFTVSYLYNAGMYLVDKSRMDWAPASAVLVALASWCCSGWPTTVFAASLASAKTATPSWARWWRCWCVGLPTSPASGSPGGRRFCSSVPCSPPA